MNFTSCAGSLESVRPGAYVWPVQSNHSRWKQYRAFAPLEPVGMSWAYHPRSAATSGCFPGRGASEASVPQARRAVHALDTTHPHETVSGVLALARQC